MTSYNSSFEYNPDKKKMEYYGEKPKKYKLIDELGMSRFKNFDTIKFFKELNNLSLPKEYDNKTNNQNIENIKKRDLRISTMTATASLGLLIDLHTLYHQLPLYDGKNKENIISINTPPPLEAHPTKAKSKLKKRSLVCFSKKKKRSTEEFYNQISISLKIDKKIDDNIIKKNDYVFIKSENIYGKVINIKNNNYNIILDKDTIYYQDLKLYLKTHKYNLQEKINNLNKLFYVTVKKNLQKIYRKIINFKVFLNGKIQITGIKCIENGHKIIDIMKKHIIKIYNNKKKRIDKNNKEVQFLVKEDQPELINEDLLKYLTVSNFQIVLINSDFSVNFKIIRKNLYNLLVDTYGIHCSYSPDSYPGLLTKFYYNKIYLNNKNFGVCNCKIKRCNGKGKGILGEGDCKKITISTFQSGNIIITGARTIKQIECCYNFIMNVLCKHMQFIIKKEIKLKTTNEILKSQIKFIVKKNIKNYNKYKLFLNL